MELHEVLAEVCCEVHMARLRFPRPGEKDQKLRCSIRSGVGIALRNHREQNLIEIPIPTPSVGMQWVLPSLRPPWIDASSTKVFEVFQPLIDRETDCISLQPYAEERRTLAVPSFAYAFVVLTVTDRPEDDIVLTDICKNDFWSWDFDPEDGFPHWTKNGGLIYQTVGATALLMESDSEFSIELSSGGDDDPRGEILFDSDNGLRFLAEGD